MKLTKKDFAAWLAKNKRKRFVQMNPCDCALAAFLSAQEGCEVHVLPEEAYSDKEELALPTWARKFVSDFDTIDAIDGTTTGAKALTLL
jgi:hypothetical protein